MNIRTELNLRLPNSPGAVASVCQLLADDRVAIVAMSLAAGGELRLVVDNPVRGAGVLRAHHHRVAERDVLFLAVANGLDGVAAAVTLVSGAGVNVEYAYGGGSDRHAMSAIVLGVDDVMRAAALAGV